MNSPPTHLEPPGAGLPKTENWLIRYLIFPTLRLKLSKKNSIDLFRTSGHSILNLIEPLNAEQLTTPVLIKRLPGLEDSSRYWSVEMTLEHIQIVSAAAFYIIKKLEAGQFAQLPVRTADAKPTGGLGLARVAAFRSYLAEFPDKMDAPDYRSRLTHHHPWFGELPSLDWLRLIAFHQNLHLKQIRAILKSLSVAA